jgi:hypothetical protein
LSDAGVRVLFDDRRGVSPGVKFNDSELIGVPTIVVVGRGLADGVVEVKDRASGERVDVAVDEAVAHLVALVSVLAGAPTVVDLDVLVWLALAALVAGWVDAVAGGGGLLQVPALLLGLPGPGVQARHQQSGQRVRHGGGDRYLPAQGPPGSTRGTADGRLGVRGLAGRSGDRIVVA